MTLFVETEGNKLLHVANNYVVGLYYWKNRICACTFSYFKYLMYCVPTAYFFLSR